MNRPLIGVMPLIDYEKKSYWMLPGYLEGILRAGGIPVMLPPTNDTSVLLQLAASCDGFLFTGGQDVSPSLYGEEKLEACGEISAARDEMEKILLHMAQDADLPVLGICRGIQFINAAMGGTLYQDLPTQHPPFVDHHQAPPYDVPVHKVEILRDTPLYDILKDYLDETGNLKVNSYHHQAVKDKAQGLQVAAVSEDGIIEGLYDPSKTFFHTVQWHPEFSVRTDESSMWLFKAFVDACGSYRSRICGEKK